MSDASLQAIATATTPPAAIFLPLASGLGYVAAVLLIKRASVHGVGLWRTAFVSNLVMGLCFAPLWLLGGDGSEIELVRLWQAALGAGLFFAGQIFTFLALGGDVSLATPVLGLKILFVAAASSVLVDEPVKLAWWLAAALATVAIVLLQSTPRPAATEPLPPLATPGTAKAGAGAGAGAGGAAQAPRVTIAYAALAAACFAVADVLVQRFTPEWGGAGRFLPVMFGLLALFSFGLVPVFSAPLSSLPRAAWPWLASGAVLLALQAASLGYTLGTHGRATVANILYSTRGLWSVLAVGLLGAWLGTAGERRLPRAVFRRRLWGAGLLCAAIVLVLG